MNLLSHQAWYLGHGSFFVKIGEKKTEQAKDTFCYFIFN